jgi:hypothetical protein
LLQTGTDLWRFVRGAYSFFPKSSYGLSDENEELIAAFFDNLRDWLDAGDLDSYRDELYARRCLDEKINELVEAGFVVGAREKFLLLTGGVNSAPSPWRAFDIEVHPFSVMQMVDADGKPINLDQIMSKYADVVDPASSKGQALG